MSVKLALIVTMCMSVGVQSSQDVMKQLSINFAKPLEVCKNEMGIPDSVIQDMANFWREGYDLKDRQIGCAILCLASKLELLDAEYNLHHGNAMDFAKKHGADHAMAQQLVDIIHSCSQPQPDDPVDPCEKTLKSAICFKAEIHKLNWAPSADLIVAELLAES